MIWLGVVEVMLFLAVVAALLVAFHAHSRIDRVERRLEDEEEGKL